MCIKIYINAYNKIIPLKGYKCINLFGVLFVRKGCTMGESDYNREAIHTKQMKELLYVPFYILYLLEWFYRLTQKGNAYRNISFEKEAYDNENDMDYLDKREHFSWIEYI